MGLERRRRPASVRPLRPRAARARVLGFRRAHSARRVWHVVAAGDAPRWRPRRLARRLLRAAVHRATPAQHAHGRRDLRRLVRGASRVVSHAGGHPTAHTGAPLRDARQRNHHHLGILPPGNRRAPRRPEPRDSRDSSRRPPAFAAPRFRRGRLTGRTLALRGIDLQPTSCSRSHPGVRTRRARTSGRIARHRRRQPQLSVRGRGCRGGLRATRRPHPVASLRQR